MWAQGLGAQIPLFTMRLRGSLGPGQGRRKICNQSKGKGSASHLQPTGPVAPAMTNYRRSWESGLYVKYPSFQSLAPNSLLNTEQVKSVLSLPILPNIHVPAGTWFPASALGPVSSAQDT